MTKDYYSVLGVARNATARQIRERFRELARQRHPDRFRGSEKASAELEFQDITEAFNVLGSPERRRQHDGELQRPPAEAGPDPGRVARIYLQRGIRAFKEGDYLEAAANFDRATREEPANAQAWHHLALACSRRGSWLSRAASAVVRACDLEPMNSTYLKLAGRLHARTGAFERAERYYEEALAWGGEDPEIQEALEEVRRGARRGPGGGGRFRKGGA